MKEKNAILRKKYYLTGRQKMGNRKRGICGKGIIQMKNKEIKNGKWRAHPNTSRLLFTTRPIVKYTY
jgi:hypothetical protein